MNSDYKIIFDFDDDNQLVCHVLDTPMSMLEVCSAITQKNFHVFTDNNEEFNVVNMKKVNHFKVTKLKEGERR